MEFSHINNDALSDVKASIIKGIDERLKNHGIEETNADLIKRLVQNAENINDALMIQNLGTRFAKTGIQFERDFEKVLNEKRDTIHYLKRNKKLSFKTNENAPLHKLIIGENFYALKNLLISHRGKVDVIYIDPPYGKDSMGEFAQTNYHNAISRDNLLTMLEIRLEIAKMLLSDNGVIFCSIDDKNQAYVKCLFDDIFGERNFVANLIWQNKYTIANDKTNGLSTQTEYILCYCRNVDNVSFIPAPLREAYIKTTYKNPDNDPNGPYMTVQMFKYKNPKAFSVVSPTGTVWERPWNFTPQSFKELDEKGYVYWGKDGNSCPRKKVYLKDSKGTGRRNLLLGEDVGYTDNSSAELKKIFEEANVFQYSKPTSLIAYLIQMCEHTSIVLDFFAGSGTTCQAVQELNNEDGGNRECILVQMDEKTPTTPNGIATDVTAKRLKRVMTGSCYDGSTDFEWIKNNAPLGSNLDVYDIASVSVNESNDGLSAFDVIDETIYGCEKFTTFKEKVDWVCSNFSITTATIEKGKSNAESS